MIINYYRPKAVTVDALLKRGIAAGAYDHRAGWIYQGLINLSHAYGLDGVYYDLTGLNKADAFVRLKTLVADGPLIMSVYYTFTPGNPIPHLVVVNAITEDAVYVNDPATKGTKKMSLDDFIRGMKRKIIVIRPAHALAADR
jgi:ABC-type bacteriocin/lantibiotic exporter with double-glycine peptidase domain